MDEPCALYYCLDESDHIVKVSREWDDFALANGGASATASKVVGRPLWTFIAGDPTRMWLYALLSMARAFGGNVARPYRCDSPPLRRFMEMRIAIESAGMLRLEHRVLRTEVVTRAAASASRSFAARGFVRRCSICTRVEVDSQWTEPQGAIRHEIAHRRGGVQVIHTVCDTCTRHRPGSTDGQ